MNETASASQKHWYAARSRNNSSKKIKELLEELNIEHFLPLRKMMTERDGKKVMVIRPLASNLVFIHASFRTALTLANSYNLPMSYMIDRSTHSLLVVPDRQMKDFMFLMEFSDENVMITSQNLRRGDRVRVMQGEFAGIEGELVRLKGHKRVVVRLEGLFSLVTTYIPGAYLEKIEE